MKPEIRKATPDDLRRIWEMNIADNAGDDRWIESKDVYIAYNESRKASTYVVLCDDRPVGEGTLLFSPDCGAVGGRNELADNKSTANINSLRIRKEYEGKGYISALVRVLESYAAANGYTRLTIGVEARETRNLAIYLHWGYNTYITSETENDNLVLYYAKDLRP